MRQTACLVINRIIVDGYAPLFNCTTAVRASDSMTAYNFNQLIGAWRYVFGFARRGSTIALRVAAGPRVKLAGRKNAVTHPQPPVVYSTDRSKAMVPGLVLFLVALWFILRGDLF